RRTRGARQEGSRARHEGVPDAPPRPRRRENGQHAHRLATLLTLPAPRRILAWRLAAAALGILVVALTFTPITNNDLFLHLLTGRLVLEQHAVPTVDDYSALARGRPYIAHEWLSAVLFRLLQAAGPGEGWGRL